MAMGKRRRRPKQTSMWVNQILDTADFDGHVETLCERFCADDVGRPGLPPGRYFRMLLLGYFEGLDSERAIAWRAVLRSADPPGENGRHQSTARYE